MTSTCLPLIGGKPEKIAVGRIKEEIHFDPLVTHGSPLMTHGIIVHMEVVPLVPILLASVALKDSDALPTSDCFEMVLTGQTNYSFFPEYLGAKKTGLSGLRQSTFDGVKGLAAVVPLHVEAGARAILTLKLWHGKEPSEDNVFQTLQHHLAKNLFYQALPPNEESYQWFMRFWAGKRAIQG